MRGKYAAYLWASGLFLLIAATDTLFALPADGSLDKLAVTVSLPKCQSETGMPSSVASSRERSSGQVPMQTPSGVLKNLVCSLSGN